MPYPRGTVREELLHEVEVSHRANKVLLRWLGDQRVDRALRVEVE